jgi:hypothetical protein
MVKRSTSEQEDKRGGGGKRGDKKSLISMKRLRIPQPFFFIAGQPSSLTKKQHNNLYSLFLLLSPLAKKKIFYESKPCDIRNPFLVLFNSCIFIRIAVAIKHFKSNSFNSLPSFLLLAL